jgi:hypothetical protein
VSGVDVGGDVLPGLGRLWRAKGSVKKLNREFAISFLFPNL